MLTWIGLAALAGAAVVACRWLLHHTDSLDRRIAFPSLGVGFLLIVAVAALTPTLLRMRLEDRLAAAASQIVGAPAGVHCQSFGEAFVDAGFEQGFVRFGPDGVPERKTLIKREPCRSLSAYLRSDKTAPSRDQIVAVHVLTHEAIHMSGVTNESETECVAVQRDAEMARLLGASPGAAQALAVSYWREIYPSMPEEYRSGECRGGGRLDIRSADAPWLAPG